MTVQHNHATVVSNPSLTADPKGAPLKPSQADNARHATTIGVVAVCAEPSLIGPNDDENELESYPPSSSRKLDRAARVSADDNFPILRAQAAKWKASSCEIDLSEGQVGAFDRFRIGFAYFDSGEG